MIVRKLTLADAEEYRACRLDALRDSPTSFLSSYEEEAPRILETFRERMEKQSNTDNAIFGAFDGERMIGLTGIFREERIKRRHKMFIVSVFVRPEYRGKGIGHTLMEAAIAHARDIEGIERLELSVESNNTAAKALYAAHGFQTWGTEPAFLKLDGVRYNEDCMTLKL